MDTYFTMVNLVESYFNNWEVIKSIFLEGFARQGVLSEDP